MVQICSHTRALAVLRDKASGLIATSKELGAEVTALFRPLGHTGPAGALAGKNAAGMLSKISSVASDREKLIAFSQIPQNTFVIPLLN